MSFQLFCRNLCQGTTHGTRPSCFHHLLHPHLQTRALCVLLVSAIVFFATSFYFSWKTKTDCSHSVLFSFVLSELFGFLFRATPSSLAWILLSPISIECRFCLQGYKEDHKNYNRRSLACKRKTLRSYSPESYLFRLVASAAETTAIPAGKNVAVDNDTDRTTAAMYIQKHSLLVLPGSQKTRELCDRSLRALTQTVPDSYFSLACPFPKHCSPVAEHHRYSCDTGFVLSSLSIENREKLKQAR